MIIASALLIMAAALASAYLLSTGLPEAMRALALALLRHARKLDERRAERDAIVRQGLNLEIQQEQ